MIPQIHLKGDYFTLGMQHGSQVRPMHARILTEVKDNLASLSKIPFDILPVLEEVYENMEAYAKPVLEMMRGIAGALEIQWEQYFRHIMAAAIRDYFHFQPSQRVGCTNWAAVPPVTRGGSPIMAKNRDYLATHLSLQRLAWTRPVRGYRYVNLTSAGSPGVFSSGMNEVGLAVGDSHVISSDIGPGLPRFAAMQELLEHHDRVNSAIDYLKNIPHIGDGNLLILDANGDMVVFESGCYRSDFIHPGEGYLISTNHFESPKKRGHWQGQVFKGNPNTSIERYEKIRQNIRSSKGEIDTVWAKHLMAVHDGPFRSICRHPDVDSIKSSTISSVLYLPQEKRLHLANGYPCRVEFELYSFP